jgi:hypothetical protein
MTDGELVEGDYQYITIHLKDFDPVSGSITYHDMSGATPIYFRMKKSGATTVALDVPMSIVTPTTGEVRTSNPVTIPTNFRSYGTEIEVTQGGETITWIGPTFEVRKQIK